MTPSLEYQNFKVRKQCRGVYLYPEQGTDTNASSTQTNTMKNGIAPPIIILAVVSSVGLIMTADLCITEQ